MSSCAKRYTKVTLYRLKLVRERTARYPLKTCAGPTHVASLLHALLDDSDRERVLVVAVNGHNDILGVNEGASGGIHCCNLDVRNVLKFALLVNATAIILGHNHPDGRATPSKADVDMTESLKTACAAIGIPLVDHVIVAPNGCSYSMHEHGVAGLGGD